MVSSNDLENRLREVGIRPTKPRMLLGGVLVGSGDRHITAEQLQSESVSAGRHESWPDRYHCTAGKRRRVSIVGKPGKVMLPVNRMWPP